MIYFQLYLVAVFIGCVGLAIGQYQKGWTQNAEFTSSLRMNGVDGSNRIDIVESLALGTLLQCNKNMTSVPPHKINDNYCDCLMDGLDEPSTSACSNVFNSPYFWCENKGTSSIYIPTSKVQDGICDCCDGSDEVGVHGSICRNSCRDEHEEAERHLIDVKEGLMKRKTLETDVKSELLRLRKHADAKLDEIKMMMSTSWQLTLHQEKLAVVERRRRRFDILDHWAGEDPATICIANDQVNQDHDIESTCWPKQSPSIVQASSQSSDWLQRAHDVKLTEGPMTGLTLGMWLQRQTQAGRKKLSQKYATSAQYKDRTTLLSWLINSPSARQRVVTLSLLLVGSALSPVIWPLQYMIPMLVRSDKEEIDEEDHEDGSWWDAWKRVSVLRKVYTFYHRVYRASEWSRRVVVNAPSTVLSLYDPTKSWAFELGLLHYSDEVALVQQGIRVIEVQVGAAKARHARDVEERKEFSNDREVWFPFRKKCYSFKQRDDHFKFCPFQEVTLNGQSIGEFEQLQSGSAKMIFKRGTKGACDRLRSSKVLLECSASYSILSVHGNVCEYDIVFGSPIVCTSHHVDAAQSQLFLATLP